MRITIDSISEDWLREQYNAGKTVSQIADSSEFSRASIHRALVKFGIVAPRKYAPQKLSKELLYQLHVIEGMTAVRIAALLGYNHASISRIIKRYGLDPKRPLINIPQAPPITKEKLLQLYNEQLLSCIKIAKQYGVGGSTVNRWLQYYEIPRRKREQRFRTHYERMAIPTTRFGREFNPPERNKIFERDGWKCLLCGCSERWQLEAHHIIPIEHGGDNAVSNGATVCRPCHITIKRRELQYVTVFKDLIK